MALIGFDFGKSKSRSSSTDSVFLANLFEQLYGGASAAASGIDTSSLTEAANQLFTQGGGFISSLQEAAGTGATEDQVSSLKADLDAFFNETILPGITSDAASVGQLGGGREGVAQGAAAEGLLRTFASESGRIRGAGADRQIGAAATGLSFLPQQFGFAQESALAPLSPYLALSQVLGDPTVLNQQYSAQDSFNLGLGFG